LTRKLMVSLCVFLCAASNCTGANGNVFQSCFPINLETDSALPRKTSKSKLPCAGGFSLSQALHDVTIMDQIVVSINKEQYQAHERLQKHPTVSYRLSRRYGGLHTTLNGPRPPSNDSRSANRPCIVRAQCVNVQAPRMLYAANRIFGRRPNSTPYGNGAAID
jgi:hypothetical protein